MLYTAKNQKLLKTGCNNVFGATLFNVVNNQLFGIVTPAWLPANSGSILFNIVDNQKNVAPSTLLHPVFNNLAVATVVTVTAQKFEYTC